MWQAGDLGTREDDHLQALLLWESPSAAPLGSPLMDRRQVPPT